MLRNEYNDKTFGARKWMSEDSEEEICRESTLQSYLLTYHTKSDQVKLNKECICKSRRKHFTSYNALLIHIDGDQLTKLVWLTGFLGFFWLWFI